jgi:hypothetical protein
MQKERSVVACYKWPVVGCGGSRHLHDSYGVCVGKMRYLMESMCGMIVDTACSGIVRASDEDGWLDKGGFRALRHVKTKRSRWIPSVLVSLGVAIALWLG